VLQMIGGIHPPQSHQNHVEAAGQNTRDVLALVIDRRSAKKPAADAMNGMDSMTADLAMHQQMMERMGQCRDMMSMMMDHMKHSEMKQGAPAHQ
jgi:hypothetical protein